MINSNINKRKKKRINKELYEYLHNNWRFQKYVKVNDDWYPNFPKHQVLVSLFIIWRNDSGKTIMSVWGMDDTGVDRRFDSDSLDELKNKFNEWKKFYDTIPQTTNMKWYLDRGFDRA